MIRRLLFLVAATAMLATACSATDSTESPPKETLSTTTTEIVTTTTVAATTSTSTAPDDGFPVTIDAPNGRVTIETRPERIVSIAPTSTEVLFAIGAGDQVVAVDDRSNFPDDAPVSELSAFTPSVEAIASFNPDLVFLSFDPSGIVEGLEAIGIPVILHGTAVSVDDAYTQWEQVGAATGNIAGAAALVAGTTASIAAAFESLPDGTDAVSYYYELSETFYSLTSSTFVGDLLRPAGMENIADAADADGYGFPQLSAEYIIDSDPVLILLADTKCCGVSSESVAERPGWDTLSAVANGGVVELDDDIASRWGPRISELVDSVVAAILQLELAAA